MPAVIPDSFKAIGGNMANLSKALANRNANLSANYAARGNALDSNDFLKDTVNNIPTFDNGVS
jgi:hypothetical protein